MRLLANDFNYLSVSTFENFRSGGEKLNRPDFGGFEIGTLIEMRWGRRQWTMLVALLALLAIYKRKSILSMIRKIIRATGNTVDASERIGSALKSAATDFKLYLYPPSSSSFQSFASLPSSSSSSALHMLSTNGVASSASPLRRSSSRPGAGTSRISMHTNNANAAASDEEVPRSLRRLLRVLATPESVTIIRNIASGAAQGVVREATREWDEFETIGAAASSSSSSSASSARQKSKSVPEVPLAARVFTALQTPGGEKVVITLISSVIREAIHVVFDRMEQGEMRRNQLRQQAIKSGNEAFLKESEQPSPIIQTFVSAGLSAEGRMLFGEIAAKVTAAALPIILQEKHHVCQDSDEGSGSASVSASASASNSSVPSVAAGAGSKGSYSVLDSIASLVLKDKQLVKELVRSVSSEVVRSYLTTKHALRKNRVESSGCGNNLEESDHAAHNARDAAGSASSDTSRDTITRCSTHRKCAKCTALEAASAFDMSRTDFVDKATAVFELVSDFAKRQGAKWIERNANREPSYLFL